ncbi:MAG: phage tail protein I [Litorimonas sp.]
MSEIATLLPPPSAPLELALDRLAGLRLDMPVPVAALWSPDDCPAPYLDGLAATLSVEIWDRNWDEDRKRAVIASAVAVHRHKGTVGSLRRALAALDMDMVVSEWFDHGGTPGSFRVDVHPDKQALTADTIALIRETIHRAKNTRSWLDGLRVFLSARIGRGVAAIGLCGIRQHSPARPRTATVRRGVAVASRVTVRQHAGARP